MAFIKCLNCGEQIDNVDFVCPHCNTMLKYYCDAFIGRCFKMGAVALAVAVVSCLMGICAISNDTFSVVGIICLSVGMTALIPTFVGFSAYKTAVRKRRLAETDYVAYREFVEKEKIKRAKAEQQARDYEESLKKQQQAQETKKYNNYKYRCPMCGSNKIKNISMTQKVVSAELLGLASNKIGKTYQCDECKYMW